MTLQETEKLITTAMQSYPQRSKADGNFLSGIWYTTLKGCDYTLCKYALVEHISTSKFFPTPPEIKEIAKQIENACQHPIFDLFGVMVLNADFNSSTVSQYVIREAFKTKQAL